MDKVERRQQILSHARDVFARRGYHEAKIDDIVAAAGIARGTFYLYFEDKRRSSRRSSIARSRRSAWPSCASIRRTLGVPWPIRCTRTSGASSVLLLEDRPTTKILLTDAVGRRPGVRSQAPARFTRVVENLLVESLRDGQALGVVAPGDARMFAYLILGAMKELLCQVVRRGADYSDKQVVDGIYDFLEQGCLRVRAAPRGRR